MRRVIAPVALLLSACGGDGGGPGADKPDGGKLCGCRDDRECPGGQSCVLGCCEAAPRDAGEPDEPVGTGPPRLLTSPTELDFGAQLPGVETSLPLVLANVGEGPLHVTVLTIEESGTLDEYFSPDAGPVEWTILVGDTRTVTVVLLPVDDEDDLGDLVIESDDPAGDRAVPLISEVKGQPELNLCVLTGPDPFADCRFPEEISYDGVAWGGTEVREVALRNGIDDNQPLEIYGVSIPGDSGFGDLFAVDLYALAGDPPVETPVPPPTAADPFVLEAGDASTLPDLLFARVTYDVLDDGGDVPAEVLRVVSNDPDGERDVPIVGVEVGCPEGFVDLNGLSVDGCEAISCPPSMGNCDGIDANGCETALGTLADCGGCGDACALPNASAACVSGACQVTACDAGWGSCDGLDSTGCETSLTTSTDCGSCGAPCTLPNATASCATGACTLSSCDAGFSDCDAEAATGCETSLTTLSDCGACEAACDVPNAGESCATGACTMTGCAASFGDCDADAATGCETPTTTLANCGACGVPCSLANAAESCSTGACVLVACTASFGNCDGDDATGCEAPLTTLVDCGSCGAVCALPNAGETCAGGSCVMTGCAAGWGDCDGVTGNGCEVSLATLSDCGACGATCALANASESCATGACTLVSCDAGYGNCDGVSGNGCETALTTPANCGACGAACDLPNASESCSTGACLITTCAAGYGDCDGDDATGCEVNLGTSTTSCGACGNACTNANGTTACVGGACSPTCAANFADCDGDPDDGCEAAVCGGCGAICDLANATESCATGVCELIACDAGFGNCDGAPGNGCEAALTTTSNCGTCGTACTNANGTTSCTGGACSPVCAAGYASCDGNPNNGCEQSLSTLVHCGACGVACSLPNASETCAGGTCAIASCNAGFGDCDGGVASGCETALTTTANCGACGTACTNANGTTACVGGACSPTCAAGFGDCDGDPGDGCETSLTTLVSCGACGSVCALPNASESCAAGTCTLVACAAGFGNCDGAAANGCEASLTGTSNCGACGVTCINANGTTSCVGGACAPVCAAGFADCDASAANGCETDLGTTLAHCGACGNACTNPNGTTSCVGGACAPSCAVGFGDCNGDPDDGCEASLNTLVNCATCGGVCALPNATESCATGTCVLTGCAAGFGDCNGISSDGCEASTTTASNCGSCGTACTNANGTTSCTGGACAPVCSAGFGDCDGDPNDGCETSLTTLANCGACGATCDLPNASETCGGGACAVGACSAGWGDCNGVAFDGCETPFTTTSNCGACGNTCTNANGSTTCSGGACAPTCAAGYMSCNGDPDDGCETSTTTLANCGGCGAPCALANASESCATGTCTVTSCDPTFGDCNGLASDGCEVSLTTLANCGSCGAACVLANATESCSTGTCTLVSCSAGFGNCNGATSDGCETSTTTLTNCGTCGNACTNANGSTSCTGGVCAPVCSAGFGNCDGNASNGCEQSLSTLAHCGGCGVACSLANASESCATGSCVLTTCDAGWGDCNASTADGCELSLTTTSNCGACGTTCTNANGSTTCSGGFCVPSCSAGYASCDSNPNNGCEANTSTSTSNCGSCGTTCTNPNGGVSCTAGACTPSCSAGYASCDGNPNNGCETSTTTLTNCGSCGTPCALANATESCATGSCVISSCDSGWGNCDGVTSTGCEASLSTTSNCGTCGTTCAYACQSPALGCLYPDTCATAFEVNALNYGPTTFTDNMSNYAANVAGTCGSAGDDVIHEITIPESGGFTAFSTIVMDTTGSAVETAAHIATTCGSSSTQQQHDSDVCGAATSSGTTCYNPAGAQILRACGMPSGAYYATVDSTVSTGAYTFTLTVDNVTLDTCVESGNVSNPPLTVTNTTTGKGDDYTFDLTTADSPCAGPPSVRKECGRPNGAPGGSSLWTCYPSGGLPDAEEIVFYYRPAASGLLTVTTAGSSYDTILYIKDACIANCSTPANCLRCNDDHNFGTGAAWSQIYEMPVTAGTVYYIFVDGYGGGDGNVVLNVTWSP